MTRADAERGHGGPALFPSVLGSAFDGLPRIVRRAHGGGVVRLSGTATVTRGEHWSVGPLAAIAALPPTAERCALEVDILTTPDGERWTRRYGMSHVMRSTLQARTGEVIESIGPVRLHFDVDADHAGMRWTLRRIDALRVPLPTDWFEIGAKISADGERYRLSVSASLRYTGLLVRYEGELDVVG